MNDQPVQHDVIVTPGGPCGSRYAVSIHDVPRGFLGTFGNWDEARTAILARQEADQVWGDVWWCSDHGNLWRIRIDDGSEIKPGDEDAGDNMMGDEVREEIKPPAHDHQYWEHIHDEE